MLEILENFYESAYLGKISHKTYFIDVPKNFENFVGLIWECSVHFIVWITVSEIVKILAHEILFFTFLIDVSIISNLWLGNETLKMRKKENIVFLVEKHLVFKVVVDTQVYLFERLQKVDESEEEDDEEATKEAPKDEL